MSQPLLKAPSSPPPTPYRFSTLWRVQGNSSRARPGLLAGAALLALVALAGCRDSSGSSATGTVAKLDPALTVSRTTPQSGASDVSPSTPVEVTFSHAINFDTVSSDTFSVMGSVSGDVTGEYTHDAELLHVTFTPSSDFAPGEEITVRLSRDLLSSKDAPLEPLEIRFTVHPDGGEEPPGGDPPAALEVVSLTPAPGAVHVAEDQEITIVWSEELDPSSVSDQTVWISSDQTGRVAASLDPPSADPPTLTVRAARLFRQGETITVHLSAGLRGASEAAFSGVTFGFQAAARAPLHPRTEHKIFSTLGPVDLLATGDVDDDGLTDVACTVDAETFVDVLQNRGDGVLELALRVEVGQPVLALLLADLDADGDLDVLTGTQDRARVYWNRGVEDRAAAQEGDDIAIRFEEGPQAPVGAPVRSLAAGDLDHRRGMDFVLDTDTGLAVHLDGIDGPAWEILGTDRQSRSSVVLVDVDLDGWLDIVFADTAPAAPAERGIAYYLARTELGHDLSPAWFQSPPATVAVGGLVRDLAAGDLDGDGLPDFAALLDDVTAGQSALRIATQGAGGFTITGGGAGAADVSLALADLDGDGRDDLLTANRETGKVAWVPNTTGGIDAQDAQVLFSAPHPHQVRPAILAAEGGLGILAAAGSEIHLLLEADGGEEPPPQGTFQLAVDPVEVHAEDTGAGALVRLTNAEPLQGYSIVLGYDPQVVVPQGVSLEGSVTETADPDFADFQVKESGDVLVYSVLVELMEPFEGRVLPAGENQLLFRLLFDVPQDAPEGESTISFPEVDGTPPLATELVAGGQTVRPEVEPGVVTVVAGEEPPPPSEDNTMHLSDASGPPGSTVVLDVTASSTDPMDAFTTVVAFDSGNFEITGFDLTGTITEDQAPEQVLPKIVPEEGYASFTVILDFLPPYDRQTIPAGRDLFLASLSVHIGDDAPLGEYPVLLQNAQGSPPQSNLFVVHAQSVYPSISGGSIRVGGSQTGPEFIRGDVDLNDAVDLADAVQIANHLFLGGEEPLCFDAADTDDTGVINLTDAIFLLNHLFMGGDAPPPPYPERGIDPTPDDLGCEGP